jgi:hypothetical protein
VPDDGFLGLRGKQVLEKGRLRRTRFSGQGVVNRDPKDSGAWESPVLEFGKLLKRGCTLNPSWLTHTPAGSHVVIWLRVRRHGHWGEWADMGHWALHNTRKFRRHSARKQATGLIDDVDVDTFTLLADEGADACQLRVELFGRAELHGVAIQAASPKRAALASKFWLGSYIEHDIAPMSQYKHTGEYKRYGGGGKAWCGAVSAAMGLEYLTRYTKWSTRPTRAQLATLPADKAFDKRGQRNGSVPYAALHAYDEAYDGTGNWAFLAAYAYEAGQIASFVRRFHTLADVEKQYWQGWPTIAIASLRWNNRKRGQRLRGAIKKSKGHLLVIAGFTENGDVIVYDPATHKRKKHADVRRVYRRDEFERQWNGAVIELTA